jgi:hypothetical protein|tara:strand:+ start:12077 stop:12508 length:432 start_codon:yes stop_codon:yes gene_type:complete
MYIWIAGNVPSSKNSKINTSRGSFHSKTVKKYLQNLGVQTYSVRKQTVLGYKTRPNKFEALRESFVTAIGEKEYPLKIGFHFVRGTRHKCDFHNIVQIIADLMVAHKFVDDDNMDCFLPFPLKRKGSYYSYDKESPGVMIKIL